MTIDYTYTVNSTNYNPAATTWHFRVVSRGAGGGGTAGVVVNDFDVASGTQAMVGNTTDIVLGVKEQTGTEGTRNFTLEAADNASFTGKVTLDFQVEDGNAAASPTYVIQGSDPLTVSEVASAQTITVNTTNVTDGTTLYWNITTDAPGSTQASTDWAAYNSGGTGFTINSNTGSFSIDALADTTTETAETYYLQVRTGSDTGTSVDSIQLDITDDSQSAPSESPQWINATGAGTTIGNPYTIARVNTGPTSAALRISGDTDTGGGGEYLRTQLAANDSSFLDIGDWLDSLVGFDGTLWEVRGVVTDDGGGDGLFVAPTGFNDLSENRTYSLNYEGEPGSSLNANREVTFTIREIANTSNSITFYINFTVTVDLS
jgi:hypothetical protein